MSTIITKRQFPNYHKYELDLAGRPLTLEVGKLAELANAAVMVGYGDTRVLCCVTAAPRPRDGIDFFPLSVDFEEKLYSVGRIPGSFNRREGRPGEKGILTSRVIDRPIRPLFPSRLPQRRVRHVHRHERGPRLLPRDRRPDRHLRRPGHLRHPLERPRGRAEGGSGGRQARLQPHQRASARSATWTSPWSPPARRSS